MTTKEYIEIYDKYGKATEEETIRLKEFNKALIEKYPFLLPRNVWTGKLPEDYDYSYTWLDDMPTGWRLAFGDNLVEELGKELKRFNFDTKYELTQIKEKYGGLRWYDCGYPIGTLSEIDKTIVQEDFKYPESDRDIDHWEFAGKTDDGKYRWTHRTILDNCEVGKILRKYESLSYKTCICCGKPAKYVTEGWISPFCEDCIKDVKDSYHEIHGKDIPKWETL